MKLVFTGPDPESPHIAHAGGQLTATSGFARFADENGIEVHWVDTAQSNFPVPALATRLKRAAGRVWRFARLVGRGDIDGAILFAGAGASFIERATMALMARACGVPSLFMIRSGHLQIQYRRSGIMRRIVRTFLRIPHRIAVQGDNWRPFLTAAGVPDERIVVVPNWLPHRPPSRAATVRTGEAPRFVFIGWMTAHKGVPELLEAMRILHRRALPASLTMIGGGTLLESSREAAAEDEALANIAITGWLPPQEVEAILARSDILVLPSHGEGFPNVVMEAMAHGLPVIATPVGAIPDSVSDGYNGAIVSVDDADALADAMASYILDPDTIAEQSRHALETVRTRHDRDSNCRLLLAGLGLEAG